MKSTFDILLLMAWCAMLVVAGDFYQGIGLIAMALGMAVISVD